MVRKWFDRERDHPRQSARAAKRRRGLFMDSDFDWTQSNREIARSLGLAITTVQLARRQFASEHLKGTRFSS